MMRPTDRGGQTRRVGIHVMTIAFTGRRPRDDIRRAVLCMMLSALLIPLLNATAKLLTLRYPIVEIIWARYAGHFIYMLLFFAPRFGVRLLVTQRPVLQIARSLLLCISTAIFFLALSRVALPTATAISFTSPFIILCLSPLILGERVGLNRWVAVGIGFAGALVVVRPGIGHEDWAAFIVFGSATTSALYQVMTRKIATHDAAETSITYIAVAGFALSSLALPFYWVTPEGLLDIGLFLAIGLFGGFGHYFLVRAYELAPASFISPFNYFQLIGASSLSYLIFDKLPDLWTAIGALIIVGSGIYVLVGERRTARQSQLKSRPGE